MRRKALLVIAVAAAFWGQPCECQYDVWHAIDEAMVICDPLPAPNPLPPGLTSWPFSKKEFPVEIAYDHGMAITKPHVVTFIREFQNAVNITYEVKDAKGVVVVERRTDQLGGTLKGNCTCTGSNGGRLGTGYPTDYGTSCKTWDATDCLKTAKTDKAGHFCCQAWCYVPETCPDAYMSVINQGGYWSYGACNSARRTPQSMWTAVTIPSNQHTADASPCKYKDHDPCECMNVDNNAIWSKENVTKYGKGYGAKCSAWDEENCNDDKMIPPAYVDTWCCQSWCWIRSKECSYARVSVLWPGLYWATAGCPANPTKMNQCPFFAKVEPPPVPAKPSGRRRQTKPQSGPTPAPTPAPTAAPTPAGLCDCLGWTPPSLISGRRRAGKAWPKTYGQTCSAWDKDHCSEYFPKAKPGIWCCQTWCWVDQACPSANPSMIANNAYWSFTACNQGGKDLRECKFSDDCKPDAKFLPPYPTGKASLTKLQDGTSPDVTISANYGKSCSAWDAGDGSATRNCYNWWHETGYWNDPPGQNNWCCEQWAFVNETCPVAIEGLGGSVYSYIVCEDLVGANTVWDQSSKSCKAPTRRLDAVHGTGGATTPMVAKQTPRLRGGAFDGIQESSPEKDAQEELDEDDEEGDLEEEEVGAREETDREKDEESRDADEDDDEDEHDKEERGEDEAELDEDPDAETYVDSDNDDAEPRALSARRRAATTSARRRSPSPQRRRQPSRVSAAGGRRRQQVAPTRRRQLPANTPVASNAPARRRQDVSGADTGRRRQGVVGNGAVASTRRRQSVAQPTPSPPPANADGSPAHRRRAAPSPRRREATPRRRQTATPRRRQTVAEAQGRRRQPPAAVNSRRRQVGAGGRVYNTARRRQPSGTSGAAAPAPDLSRRRQSYAATNTQMLDSNYNNKPPMKTSSGFTGPSKPAGSTANVMMAGAAGLAGGALLGAGSYYAYQRWTQDGKTGSTPNDYVWCEVPSGPNKGRMIRCDDCSQAFGSGCEAQQACYQGDACDFKLPSQSYRDELYTAGFVPDEYAGPLTITVYGITGPGFSKTDYCPSSLPDTAVRDNNWVKAASVKANLFVTLQETNFVPIPQSCERDTRDKCSSTAECGKNEQCATDGYCECKPGWCMTQAALKGGLPSCTVHDTTAGTANAASFSATTPWALIVCISTMALLLRLRRLL